MKEEIWKKISGDSTTVDELEKLSTEGGKQLSDLVKEATQAQNMALRAKDEATRLQKIADKYKYELLPGKMQEVGLDKVQVGNFSVSLGIYVTGTMPKDPMQKDIALTHLREIGCDDFIKNQVNVNFPVAQDAKAEALRRELESKGMETTSRVWVEPQTLKKLIRERVENSQPINLEIFNAHIGTIAKIKGEG
jgi:hypothetical protein